MAEAQDGEMVRYFFDLRDDNRFFRDNEGTELADPAAARLEAIQAMAELARDSLPGNVAKRFIMTVRDPAGVLLFELELVFRLTPISPMRG